jgi:NAD+ kinase
LKRLAKTIKRIGLIGNSGKASCGPLISRAARLIARKGRRVFSETITAQMSGLDSGIYPDAATLTREVDLVLVFGGDGTMLRVASEIAGSATPILGINVGGLGFLTAVSSPQVPRALEQIWTGDFVIESRALIEASGHCHGQSIRKCALNDFVVSRTIVSRLITLEVSVDDEPLTRYRCDGLIVSSPTGSTAYSLSAGGAVVYPTAEVIAITPICPHTLSNRSVIVSLNSKILVRVVNPKPETILSADGRNVSELAAGDAITIQRSRNSVRLMHLGGTSFSDTLRRKLNWSGANV